MIGSIHLRMILVPAFNDGYMKLVLPICFGRRPLQRNIELSYPRKLQ